MPGRRTHQHITLYSLGGVDWVQEGRAFNFRQSMDHDEIQGVAESYAEKSPVKRGQEFDFEMLYALGAAGVAQSNLDVNLFTVDAQAELAQIRDGSIRVTTRADEGSGVADFEKFPNALIRELEISGTFQIPVASSAQALLDAIATAAAAADQKVAYSISVGGVATEKLQIVAAQMTYSELRHVANHGEIQTWAFTGQNAMQLTDTELPSAKNNPLLYSILRGTGIVAFDMTTGPVRYVSAAGLLMSVNITIRDAAVLRIGGTIAVQGATTVT